METPPAEELLAELVLSNEVIKDAMQKVVSAAARRELVRQKCNDPELSAQVRPLRHTPQQVSSCPAPGVGAGGCRTGSSHRSHASRAAGS